MRRCTGSSCRILLGLVMLLLTELGQQNRLQNSSFFPLSFLSQHYRVNQSPLCCESLRWIGAGALPPAPPPSRWRRAITLWRAREGGSQPWWGALTAGRTRAVAFQLCSCCRGNSTGTPRGGRFHELLSWQSATTLRAAHSCQAQPSCRCACNGLTENVLQQRV